MSNDIFKIKESEGSHVLWPFSQEKREKANRPFKNILVVRTDRIGDVVLTTPAIHALRKAYPQARITILVAPVTADLVDGNPDLDEVMLDDRKNESKGVLGFVRLVQALRKKRFDLAIVFHTKKRTNALCFFAGIPHRMGYKNNKLGFLLTHKIKDIRNAGQLHEAQYCLDVLRHIGVEPPELKAVVPINPKYQRWVDEFLEPYQISSNDKFIAIHSGASDPTKCWPPYRFRELIERLDKRGGYRFVFIGNKEAGEVIEQIVDNLPISVISVAGKTRVGQMAALLNRCHLLVSNDSGPVHVGDAVGIPVVSIFTRNQSGINPERWRPLNPRSRVVVTSAQAPSSFDQNTDWDPQEWKTYLETISVDQVLEAVDSIFKLC